MIFICDKCYTETRFTLAKGDQLDRHPCLRCDGVLRLRTLAEREAFNKAAWLAERKTCITASEVPTVDGPSPFQALPGAIESGEMLP